MSRTSSPSFPSRPARFAALLLAVAIAGLAAPPAHAGLGDLVKKAKDKAAQAVVGKPSTGASQAGGAASPPVFTDDLLELTEPRLGQVLKGLEAGNKVLAGRAPLVQKRDRLQNEAGALIDQNGKAMDAAREKHDAAARCWSEFLDARKSERDEQMQQTVMNDPVMREKMMSLAMEMAEAQAAGDTAAMSKLQRQAAALTGPTHADSVAARQKCGAVPPPHPLDVKVQALQREAAATDEQLRANDEQSVEAQVKASGFEPAQFAMARERLIMWLQAIRASKALPRGFSEGELAAFDARRAEIETALAAWTH
jgi:hypothetical protein